MRHFPDVPDYWTNWYTGRTGAQNYALSDLIDVTMTLETPAVLEAVLYATDLDAAEHFYGEGLGLSKITRHANRHVFFRCDGAVLLIFNPEETRRLDQNPEFIHGTDGQGHVCFAATEDQLVAWKERFEAFGIDLEAEFVWPNGARSLYVRDPAGNSVEFAEPGLWFSDDR